MTKKSTKKTATGIKVSVAKVGEEVVELALASGALVSDALDMAGYTGHSARVNDEAVGLEDKLEDGDEIWVGADVKDGQK